MRSLTSVVPIRGFAPTWTYRSSAAAPSVLDGWSSGRPGRPRGASVLQREGLAGTAANGFFDLGAQLLVRSLGEEIEVVVFPDLEDLRADLHADRVRLAAVVVDDDLHGSSTSVPGKRVSRWQRSRLGDPSPRRKRPRSVAACPQT